MEILPSALCCRMRVPLFIRIKTIRKSGYFARVLELLPVSLCQESSLRNSCSSRSKSMSKRGSAKPGNRFNASMPSPGWQVLRFVTMMNTFLLCISCTNDMSHPPAVRLTIGCLEITETGQEKSSTICSQQDWSTLHNLRIRHPCHGDSLLKCRRLAQTTRSQVASQPYVPVSCHSKLKKTARS